MVARLRIPAICVRCIARSLWTAIGWERRRASAYDALLRVLALQCLQGHLLAVVAAIGVAPTLWKSTVSGQCSERPHKPPPSIRR